MFGKKMPALYIVADYLFLRCALQLNPCNFGNRDLYEGYHTSLILLGIHRNSVYNMVNKQHLFITVKADDRIRIYKDSFEAW